MFKSAPPVPEASGHRQPRSTSQSTLRAPGAVYQAPKDEPGGGLAGRSVRVCDCRSYVFCIRFVYYLLYVCVVDIIVSLLCIFVCSSVCSIC